MLAHAMDVKHNCASIGFNPLELGTAIREFIGEDKCNQANNVAHAECHPSFAMKEDWVSDEKRSKIAGAVIKNHISASDTWWKIKPITQRGPASHITLIYITSDI
jgi:hypothetical protein